MCPPTFFDVREVKNVHMRYPIDHVLAQPWHSGELDAVSDLVQAHPQPEIGGHHLKLAFDGHQVRCDQQ